MNQNKNAFRMMERLFSGVMKDLLKVEKRIYERKVFVFVRHRYSKEELISDPVFENIETRFLAFEDIIESQRSFGMNDEWIENEYYKLKMQLAFRVYDIQSKIHTRKPIGWDSAINILDRIFGATVGYITGNFIPRLPGY